MIRKHLCFGLCLFIMLHVAVPTFVQAIGPSELGATYVKFSAIDGGEGLATFPESGTTVFASTQITNNGEKPQAAVLWAGVYKSDVLVNMEYQRKLIPAGEMYSFTTPAIIIPEGCTSENTEIKAYVWDSFSGANAVTSSANMLKDSGELSHIWINGQPLDGFSNTRSSYTFAAKLDVLANAKITARAKDNATRIEIPSYTVPGQAIIKVTKSDGTSKNFTINMKRIGSIVSLTKNPNTQKKTSMEWGETLVPVTSNAYSDRSWPLVSVSENIVGGTLIKMPIADVRCSASETAMVDFMNANNTYFIFTADTDGIIYCLTRYSDMVNYASGANGWITINSGKNFFPVVYNGRTYSAYNKYVDENGVSQTATTDADRLPYTFNHTNVTSLTRMQDGAATLYAYVYAKSFLAGDTVAVPTPDNASVGTRDGAVWVIAWGEQLSGSDATLSGITDEVTDVIQTPQNVATPIDTVS